MGSPPLARDKWTFFAIVCVVWGITPACAGQITKYVKHMIVDEDHPRLRGTNELEASINYMNGGSPPLARDK